MSEISRRLRLARVTIVNTMIGTHGCEVWRMWAVDYESAIERLAPLVGELPTIGNIPVIATSLDPRDFLLR